MKPDSLAEQETQYWLALERLREKPKPVLVRYKKQPSPLEYKVTESA